MSDRPAANRIIAGRIVERARSVVAAPAKVLAFPIERQDAVVAKIAAAMMRKRSAVAADACIAKALRQYTAEMRGRGIPAIIIRREVHLMEARVRARVWALMFPWIAEIKKELGPHQIHGRRPRGRSTASPDQLVFHLE
jgi:hypothetical protein